MKSAEATLEFQGCGLASLGPRQILQFQKSQQRQTRGFTRRNALGPLGIRIKALRAAGGRKNRILRCKHGYTTTPFPRKLLLKKLENVRGWVSCESMDKLSLYLLEFVRISKIPAPQILVPQILVPCLTKAMVDQEQCHSGRGIRL